MTLEDWADLLATSVEVAVAELEIGDRPRLYLLARWTNEPTWEVIEKV